MKRENKRKRAWIEMLIRETFTAADIAKVVGISTVSCHNTLRHFAKQEMVKEVGGVGVAGNPRIFTAVLNKTPRFGSGGNISKVYKKTGRQQLWNNMKIARKFTVESLIHSINVKTTSAQQYVKALLDAGYITLTVSGKHQKGIKQGHNVYLLIRDTGRLAPRLQKIGCWDQNVNKLYPFQGSEVGKDKAPAMKTKGVNHVA